MTTKPEDNISPGVGTPPQLQSDHGVSSSTSGNAEQQSSIRALSEGTQSVEKQSSARAQSVEKQKSVRAQSAENQSTARAQSSVFSGLVDSLIQCPISGMHSTLHSNKTLGPNQVTQQDSPTSEHSESQEESSSASKPKHKGDKKRERGNRSTSAGAPKSR